MKKLVNAPDRIVDDMIDGFVAAYPGMVARARTRGWCAAPRPHRRTARPRS